MFSSLVALQVFVELGFYLVIINLASHEWARLHLAEDGTLTGDPRAMARLGSLRNLMIRYYIAGAVIFITAIGAGGALFLGSSSSGGVEPTWMAPWWSLVLLTGGLLITFPLVSLLEGCNQVRSVNRMRLVQSILATLALWGGMVSGLGLWSLVAQTAARLVTEIIFLRVIHGPLIHQLVPGRAEDSIHWRQEVWPMQWKLALTGMSGFLAFALFSPVMFRYHGPVGAAMTYLVATILGTL